MALYQLMIISREYFGALALSGELGLFCFYFDSYSTLSMQNELGTLFS